MEASMVSTRDLAQLVLLAEAADAKVVLVGNHYQLKSVEAGGLFRLLAADATAAELTGIRRFHDRWEAVATLRLRARDRSVVEEYAGRGRIRAGEREHVLTFGHVPRHSERPALGIVLNRTSLKNEEAPLTQNTSLVRRVNYWRIVDWDHRAAGR